MVYVKRYVIIWCIYAKMNMRVYAWLSSGCLFRLYFLGLDGSYYIGAKSFIFLEGFGSQPG